MQLEKELNTNKVGLANCLGGFGFRVSGVGCLEGSGLEVFVGFKDFVYFRVYMQLRPAHRSV